MDVGTYTNLSTVVGRGKSAPGTGTSGCHPKMDNVETDAGPGAGGYTHLPRKWFCKV